MIKDFSSLHGHSMFSIFDGLSTPEENVKAAKEKGLKSIALTDHGTLHGMADFYLAGKKHGVRTVFGTEAYVIHDLKQWNELREKISLEKKAKGKTLEDGVELTEANVGKTSSKILQRKGHLVILSCNLKGLANLNQLVYRAHKEGFYGKPRMDKEMLRQHSEGLVASSACMGGVISKMAWDYKDGKASWSDVVREAQEFDDIFGRGRFYLELQLNEHPGQVFINETMIKLHHETNIPLTVTTDFHYSREEEWEAREILHCLDWDKTIKDMPNGKIDTEIKQLFVKSPEEMWQTYELLGKSHIDLKTMTEAFQNTLVIDSLVEDYEPDTHTRLPTLPYKNPFKEMGQRAIEGLKRLGLAEREEYQKQLLHELQVIKDKGIANYFMVVQEIINEAKKTMLIGAGRGSAGGSLVCYALGITDLDPVKYGLMFERFLDPARIELPDIDIDFEDVDATKDMLRKMFGEDNVACLSSYGTFQTKGLLKDLARVYDLDHNEINQLNKKIDQELRALYVNQDKSTIVIKLEDIERVSPTFNRLMAEHPLIGAHFKKLYGRIRHVSRHASGVIIGDNLPAETAVFTQKGVVQTSFTEGIVNKNLSAMGFVKMDILSIATLKIIHHALRLISHRTGEPLAELRESIRPHRLDMNDQKVLKHVFWNGNFAGIFQFTEKGIRKLAQRIKPDSFDDISAVVSLYRPGPLGSGMPRLYGENKRNADSIVYDHPVLENILKRTYGCLVYQEQLMQVCNLLGKMEFKDVQRVRKVLLKKDKSKSEEFLKKENDELKGKFVKGCEENGLTEEKAAEWWKNLLYFGGYGFNASHSYDYSVMTMQCAYLATYFPLEFYSAVLTKGQSGDMQDYVSDIKKCGIKVLPVDVNKSRSAHTVEKLDDREGNGIRLSFSSVLGVGPAAIEKMVARQPYTDFPDFLERSGVGKTPIGPLIKVGAFESLSPNMKDLEEKYESFCANPKWKTKKLQHEWHARWLVEPAKDYEPHEKVFFETELMGFSLRGSPFEILDRDKKIQQLFGNTVTTYKEFIESEDDVCMLPVVLKEFKERPQKNGQLFSFCKFAVETGEEFEAPAFANIWKWIAPKMKKGAVYIGTFNRKADDPTGLLVGRPGWKHSPHDAAQYMVCLDDIEIT